MTLKDFISKTWWTTNIAIIRNNEPRRHGDMTLKEVKEWALFYGTADDCYTKWIEDNPDYSSCLIAGVGAIKGRLIIIIYD